MVDDDIWVTVNWGSTFEVQKLAGSYTPFIVEKIEAKIFKVKYVIKRKYIDHTIKYQKIKMNGDCM
jgi:hypothetical protein